MEEKPKNIEEQAASTTTKTFIVKGYQIDTDYNNGRVSGYEVFPSHGMHLFWSLTDAENFGYYEVEMDAEPGEEVWINTAYNHAGGSVNFVYRGDDVVYLDLPVSKGDMLETVEIFGRVLKNGWETSCKVWVEAAPQFSVEAYRDYSLNFTLPRGLMINIIAEVDGIQQKRPFRIGYDYTIDVDFNF